MLFLQKGPNPTLAFMLHDIVQILKGEKLMDLPMDNDGM